MALQFVMASNHGQVHLMQLQLQSICEDKDIKKFDITIQIAVADLFLS